MAEVARRLLDPVWLVQPAATETELPRNLHGPGPQDVLVCFRTALRIRGRLRGNSFHRKSGGEPAGAGAAEKAWAPNCCGEVQLINL